MDPRGSEIMNWGISIWLRILSCKCKGESALTHAVRYGSPEIVDLLIDNKADLKVADIKGNNLAYYLVQSYRPGPKDEFTEKLGLLKAKGFDVTTPQKDGTTLLHLAVAKSNLDLLKKLAPLNIDVNAVEQEQMTALHKRHLFAKDDYNSKVSLYLWTKKGLKPSLKKRLTSGF
ncbi:hypothetical protein FQR65_LT15079 [Abscondita terminalis]|nr:hypothetical protein FQR65_LT15079 [Abscondita terminalis]